MVLHWLSVACKLHDANCMRKCQLAILATLAGHALPLADSLVVAALRRAYIALRFIASALVDAVVVQRAALTSLAVLILLIDSFL